MYAEQGEEPIFSYMHEGVDNGYFCTNKTNATDQFVSKDWAYGYDCEYIYGFPEVEITSFKDVMLCGVRGGYPYYNVTRVNLTSNLCPTGTVPCSNETDPEHTVCYTPDIADYSCPIIDLRFTTRNEPDGRRYVYSSEYRIQDVGD